MKEPESLRPRLAALLGRPVTRVAPVHGGYTPAGRFLVGLGDRRQVFAKVGVTADTAAWLEREREVYAALGDRLEFMPRMLGFCRAGPEPILVLEDLSGGEHPPPWTAARIEAVGAALEALHRLGPGELGFLPGFAPPPLGWAEVARDPEPFLGLGLVRAGWLAASLPVLTAAEAGLPTQGEVCMHLDVRSDNMLFLDDGLKLFDWNHACRGTAELDLGFWLPSLAAEGGPEPEALLPDRPAVAAWVSGFFACRAGLPRIPHAPRVRVVQRFQLGPALAWAVRALDLPAPDGPEAGEATRVPGGA